jgi:hypothetical protein
MLRMLRMLRRPTTKQNKNIYYNPGDGEAGSGSDPLPCFNQMGENSNALSFLI